MPNTRAASTVQLTFSNGNTSSIGVDDSGAVDTWSTNYDGFTGGSDDITWVKAKSIADDGDEQSTEEQQIFLYHPDLENTSTAVLIWSISGNAREDNRLHVGINFPNVYYSEDVYTNPTTAGDGRDKIGLYGVNRCELWLDFYDSSDNSTATKHLGVFTFNTKEQDDYSSRFEVRTYSVAENGGLSDFIWFDVTESEIPLGSEGYAKLRIKWSVNHYDNNWSNPTEFWSDEHTSSSQKTWNFNNPDVLEVTSHNEDGDIIASGGVGGTQYGGHISGTITEQEST